MGTTRVDGEIENLQRQIRRAEAVKAAYPDAYLGSLPNGAYMWLSSAMDDCTDILLIADGENFPIVYAVPYKVLHTEDGDVNVFKPIHFGGIAAGMIERLRHNFPDAYKALVQCAMSEAR